MKIDFIVVGTQKAGTKALRGMLRGHPALSVPDCELHIFDRGLPPRTSYRAHFPWITRRLRGEVTPIYMYWQDCPEQIKRYNSDIKIISVLRCPVERAWSHWKMEHLRGWDDLPFSDAIRREDSRLDGGQHRVYSYADRGRYGQQVERLLGLFGEQVLFIKYEDYRRDHQTSLSRIFKFLSISDVFIPKVTTRASSNGAEMAPEDRKFLAEKLRPEARHVEELLGWDCSDWCRIPRGDDQRPS